MSLRLRPYTVKKATGLAFVRDVHRRHPKIQGAMWAVCVRSGEILAGVALIGHAAQEWTGDEIDTLCVLRVAVKDDPATGRGYKNACSMLYGACWRAARAMGATSMVTYTHLDEPGTSLVASGWIEDGQTEGGELTRPSRKRTAVIDPLPKRRWWAPGSERIPRPAAEVGSA